VDTEVNSLHVKRIGIDDLVDYVYIVRVDKTDLHDRMHNNLILCYIKKYIFRQLKCVQMKKTFQAMKNKKKQFSKPT
jgi:hypothetical protein